jgi:hypothetical protein
MFLGYAFPGSCGSCTKLELMRLHPHAPTAENYTFRLQTQPLLQSRLARQPDFSTCSQYPMPWQPTGAAQRPHHLPGSSGKSGGFCDIAICRHFTLRNLADRVANDAQHTALHQAGPVPCEGFAQPLLQRVLRIMPQVAPRRGGVRLRIVDITLARRRIARR